MSPALCSARDRDPCLFPANYGGSARLTSNCYLHRCGGRGESRLLRAGRVLVPAWLLDPKVLSLSRNSSEIILDQKKLWPNFFSRLGSEWFLVISRNQTCSPRRKCCCHEALGTSETCALWRWFQVPSSRRYAGSQSLSDGSWEGLGHHLEVRAPQIERDFVR